MQFARSLAQGHVVVSDLYSNTQVMTGDVLSGLGSSAAILYYNDTVTYQDGTQEPFRSLRELTTKSSLQTFFRVSPSAIDFATLSI